ncbi:MAG: hypothetical protein OEV42_19090 [Deltaproteobacteria bacterium]|nr:hypothetical protein [Deltaproteobacteria bacterium]
MLESVHMEKLSTISLNDDISEVIFGYFEAEIFYRLDEEIRLFLLKTAFMPSMTLEMAKDLTDLKQARRILSDLYGKNCFVEKRLQSPPVYQYHPLFRAFLLKEADEYFSEEEKAHLIKYAATLLSKSGQVEEAAELLIETDDLEQLIPLILENAQSYIAQGRSRVVETWILAVPESVREKNPWLIFRLGSCKMSYNIIEARSIFKKSLQLLDFRKDTSGTFLSWCGVAESILWGWDDYNSFDGWIDVLNDLVKKYKGIPEGEIETRVSTAMFSAMIHRYPDHPQFEFWKERALSLQDSSPDLNCRMSVLFHLSHYLQMCGKLKEADEVIQSIHRLLSSSNPSCLEVMQAKLTETIHANYRGDHDHCLKLVEKSLEIATRNGIHLFDAAFAGHALWSSCKRQDFERTNHYIKIIESSLPFSSPYERCLYHLIKAFFALHNKNISLAEKESRLSLQVVLKVGGVSPLVIIYSLHAYVLHELGKHEEASAALSTAINFSRRFDSQGYIFEFSLLEAYFAFHRGDEVTAFKALKAGLAQGRERGYKEALFFSLPEVNRNLYTKALLADIEVEYVQQLIRNDGLLPPEGMTDIENWPWPIKVYTLGSFRIEVDGKPLKEGRKSHHRLINILKALICLGGSNVPAYRLADIFWPEKDGDAAQSALDMGIHRLRKLLNYSEAIEVKHGELSINSKVCWIDALVFLELTKYNNDKEKNTTQSAEDVEKILSLYGGKLLPALDGSEWTMAMRENLRDCYLKMLQRLGALREASKEWGTALECYSCGVEDNPLSEEHVRGLMRTFTALGRPVDAILAYQKFEKELKNNIAIDPSPATKALFKEISSSSDI